VRSQLGLPPGYFGNAVNNTLLALPAQDLRGQSLGQLARSLRAAREKRSTAHLYAELAFFESHRDAGQARRILPTLMLQIFEHSILFNNCSKLPFYEVDFGFGPPFWYDMAMGPVPWQVIVAPTPASDGAKDVHLCAPKNKLALLQTPKFHAQLHRFAASRKP
jgi:shikimate O-hydroxycinnamoyltransferase